MKQCFRVTLCLLLTLLLCSAVLAAPTASIVRAFANENTLCTYLRLETDGQAVTAAEAKLNDAICGAASNLGTVQQMQSPVHYLLLVDNSTSMTQYAPQIEAFAAELTENAGENSRFTLGVFGEKFSLLAENIGADMLHEQVQTVAYDARASRIQDGIAGAMAYFGALSRENQELRCIVALTDGVVYNSDSGASSSEISDSLPKSDALFFSVVFGDDADARAALMQMTADSGGDAWSVTEAQSVQDAADALLQACRSLYVMSFALPSNVQAGETALTVTFSANGTFLCRALGTVFIPERTTNGGEPQERPPVQTAASAQNAAAETAPVLEAQTQDIWNIGLTALVAVLAVVTVGLLVLLLIRRKRAR